MDTTALLIKMISALAVVTGLMLLLLYFLKKMNRDRSGDDAGEIRVISIQPLMHKRHLGVVRVKDRLLILGITEQNITLLDTLHEQDDGKDTFNSLLNQAAETETGLHDGSHG